MFFSEKKVRDLRAGMDFAYICLTTDMNPEGYRDTFPGFFIFCVCEKDLSIEKRKENGKRIVLHPGRVCQAQG